MQIIFEDPHLIAVNKPAPLLTQAPPAIPSLERMVKEYIKEACQKPGGVYLGIPHRLDRPVSGVVVFARNSKAAARVAEQFQQHSVAKIYWAAVEGDVPADQGEWHNFLRKVEAESRTEIVPEGTEKSREAITCFRVLKRMGETTLLELAPKTGRMHQLRIQAAQRGHPILGDALYGSTRLFGPPAQHPRSQLVALHARSLTLVHPFRKTPLTIEAPLPAMWGELLDNF
jgi:23S rRNA pseudouridine1911/1915/1917 synthase